MHKIFEKITIGESCIEPKLAFDHEKKFHNKSFLFKGNNGKAVLLVHGWTSTPYELRRLGIYLNEKGFSTKGLLLSGHGSSPENLENMYWEKWLQDVDDAFIELRKSHEKVYVAGTSIGAILTLLLAEKHKDDVAGIVLMATPYRLRLEWPMFFLAKLLLFFGKTYHKKFYPPTFGSSGIVTRMVSYQRYPIRSVLQVLEAAKRARKNLANVTQPCLAMQSTHDHIVAKKSLDQIYLKIGSAKKEKKYIHRAYHTFIADIKNEHIFKDILSFLERN